jgi:hypothetical protein
MYLGRHLSEAAVGASPGRQGSQNASGAAAESILEVYNPAP